MVRAVSVRKQGGLEALEIIDFNCPQPLDGQIQIRMKAAEVNFLDIYQRRGTFPVPNSNGILGVSGVGIIEKVGAKVKGYEVGERVGFINRSAGAYSELVNVNVSGCFKIPEKVETNLAASVIVKGLTAHYLACRAFVTKPGTAVVIHAAAGGVGRLLASWANLRGSLVIGTVGSEAKKEIARKHGCHIVINYTNEDWVAKTLEVTKGIGVNCVYDGIGASTFEGSLKSLMYMGILVMYGSASGEVKNLDLSKISARSLFLTCPNVFDYKQNRNELLISVEELFQRIIDEEIVVGNPIVMSISEVQKAHQMLESRSVTGSIILTF